MTPSARAFALAAGALLTAAVMWLLVLGAGSSEARGHHHRGHHHSTRVRIPKAFLGVLPGPVSFDEKDAAKISATGVRTVRIGLLWVLAQRTRGPFNWATSDLMIARLAKNGVAVVPTLAGTPRWVANKGSTPPLFNQAAKDGWQTFVKAAVRRYGPDGTFWTRSGGRSPFHNRCGCSAPPVPITAWQIWNEPNLEKYFTPRPSPKQYAKLVKLSSSAIKAVDRDAKVVLAGLSDNGERGSTGAAPFLKGVYRFPGIKSSFDAAAIHPYARNLSNLRTIMTRIRRVMKRKRDAKTSLWVTEMGWGSGHPNRYGHNKGIHGQAKLLKKSITLLAQKRKTWRVGRAYWFFWRDPASGSPKACSFCSSAGLLKHDRRPKPAYDAFRRLAKRAR